MIEFALLSPFLFGGVLVIGIMGLQLHHHIQVDQVLKAGAAAAITDPGMDAVLKRMQEVAKEKGYIINETPNTKDQIIVQSVRTCFCHDDPGGQTSCSNPCPNGRPTGVRYYLYGHHVDSLIDSMKFATHELDYLVNWVPWDPMIRREVIVR